MIFASSIFLYYFLPLFLVLYYLSPKGWRTLAVALASYVFYGWWRPDFVLLMLFSTVLDYSCGRAIVRDREHGRDTRRWVALSVTVNLGLLGYFKYVNFGIDTLNHLLSTLGAGPLEWAEVVLPVGISFYTFQTLSYTVDVHRGAAPPVKDFRDFMCYVAMFPQLVAGPIVRYNTIADQLQERPHTLGGFYRGVLAFQAGLAKKVLIADSLAPLADAAFATTAGATTAGAQIASLGTLDAWIGLVAYTFQIYFDFSGYSDMAIGLGLMMGFRLPINFEQPYRALSITDFWRRWHVSLSTFLRDYLYIPLGGNRRGTLRTYVNLALTMLLGGLWHGAAWTFVVWGTYQGFWLIVERAAGKRALYSRLPRTFQIALTFLLVMVGWVFFRATSLGGALGYLAALAGFAGPGAAALLPVGPFHVLTGLAAALVVWLAPTTQSRLESPSRVWAVTLQVFFVLTLLQLQHQDHVPFLYFQF